MDLFKEEDWNIRSKQKEALCSMLNLNNGNNGTESNNNTEQTNWSDVWKILVYDDHCRDILAPLLNKAELKKQGVTLYLFLNNRRYPVPGLIYQNKNQKIKNH